MGAAPELEGGSRVVEVLNIGESEARSADMPSSRRVWITGGSAALTVLAMACVVLGDNTAGGAGFALPATSTGVRAAIARFGGGVLFGSQKVELEAAAPASPKCDAACTAKKAQIENQMKQLRDQINGDFSNMITFGNKVGYIPPTTESIKQQVMDGSLLGNKDEPKAPPPFSAVAATDHVLGAKDANKPLDPTVVKAAEKTVSKEAPAKPLIDDEIQSAKSPTSAAAPAPAAVAAPAAAAAAAAAAPAPAPAPAPVAAAAPAPAPAPVAAAAPAPAPAPAPVAAAAPAPAPVAVAPPVVPAVNDDATTTAKPSGKEAPWAKAFSFMKDTDNPIDGDSKTNNVDSSTTTAKAKSDGPLKEDKYLSEFFGGV